MQEVRISDVTLKRAGKNAAFSLTFKEKIELAKLLDRLGLSVIELEGINQIKTDSLLIKSIASAVRESTVAVPVGLCEEGVLAVKNALREAKKCRLQVEASVSYVQMEYIFHKKPADMLESIAKTVAACRKLTADVEFVADDATRSDRAFLFGAIRAAVAAGASTVTLCDTAGAMLPDEFTAFLDEIFENVPELAGVTLGVSCSNELSMADACAVAAIRRGAREVKAAAFPIDCVSLINIAKILAGKGDMCAARCSVRTTEMKRIAGQIASMFQTVRSKHSPFENGVRGDDGTVLTAHDDMAAVISAAQALGYDFSEEDKLRVWEAFCLIAARKEQVGTKELDAIVASAAMQVPAAYTLESYAINASNILAATAHIRLCRNGKTLDGLSFGDGPVDAAFLALEQIVGRHYELDDFQIQAVTEGREAMGETVVKLRSNGRLYSGRGISTDIIGASIHAYINAVNKITYEEEAI